MAPGFDTANAVPDSLRRGAGPVQRTATGEPAEPVAPTIGIGL
jgi:hypothetical protein